MTLAHLLKLLLFLELLTTTALSAVLLQYLDQPWYWVLLYVPSFFFLVRIFLISTEFFLATWFNRALSPMHLSYLAWFRCISREMLLMISNFSFHMALPSWFNRWSQEEKRDRPTANSRGVIVLVHGIACNAVVWRSMRKYLLQQGWIISPLNLNPIFAPIHHYGEALYAYIENTCQQYACEQVFVVAHSMGGLVFRSYLQQYGDQRVAHAITIATPHQGSVLASIGASANVRDMRQNSQFLRSLNSTAHIGKLTCFLTQHDNLVIPYNSSHLAGSTSVLFSGIGHVSLLFDTEVQRQVHLTLCRKKLEMNAPE